MPMEARNLQRIAWYGLGFLGLFLKILDQNRLSTWTMPYWLAMALSSR